MDCFHSKTDLAGYTPEVYSTGFGLQYSYKALGASVELKPFKLYKKPICLRWYPELSVAYGLINLFNTNYVLSGLKMGDKYYGFFQYGLIINMYINRWCNFGIMYMQEYYPSLTHDVHRYAPLQLKIIFKV